MSYLQRPIRLLIADDHQIVREGFHTMLMKRSDIELVGEAKDGNELIEMTESFLPDVIITDIKMPHLDGVKATRILSDTHPEIPVIAFTMFNEELLIVDMLEAGAQGYLVKSSGKEEIMDAMQAVMNRKTYFCKQTTPRLTKLIAESKFSLTEKIPQPTFTDTEIEIIKLICQEFHNKEIADRIFRSVRTVEGYRDRILEKINARNTAGLVIYAIRKGIYQI